MTADIRNLLHDQPFVPFTIHVADGREYRVPTADHAHVSPRGGRVTVFTDDDLTFILPGFLLSGVALDTPNASAKTPPGSEVPYIGPV